MYIGIISPTALLEKYSKPYHLQYCYGELARSNSKYLDFYKRMSKSKKVIILDYSPKLPRTTRGFGTHDIADLAKEVVPSFIVLPCVEYSYKGTMDLAKEASEYFVKSVPDSVKYLALPQGATRTEVENCACDLLTLPKVFLLGLASSLEIVWPRNSYSINYKYSIYLDTYSSYENEIPPKGTRGLVTSFPIRLGMDGKGLLDKCTVLELDFNYNLDSPKIQENVELYCETVKEW